MQQKISDTFKESIQIQIAAAESLPEVIEKAAQAMITSLLNGQKILCCGNSGAAANAQQLASSLLNRFEIERPSFPAISLTNDSVGHSAIARDSDYDNVFAKQVRALGQAGDVLVAISSSGTERNIIKAVEAAVTRDMFIIALTGKDGGELSGLLANTDVEIRIPSQRSARIHEMHMLVIHSLCDLIDTAIFSAHVDRSE